MHAPLTPEYANAAKTFDTESACALSGLVVTCPVRHSWLRQSAPTHSSSAWGGCTIDAPAAAHPVASHRSPLAESVLFLPAIGITLAEVLRYVELSPVRAKLAPRASDWEWSSARAHPRRRREAIDSLCRPASQRAAWNQVLEEGWKAAEFEMRLREATRVGRPVSPFRDKQRISLHAAAPRRASYGSRLLIARDRQGLGMVYPRATRLHFGRVLEL